MARGLVFSLALVVFIAADMDLAELNGQISGAEREIEESKALLAACEDAEAKKFHQANILSLRAMETALINQKTALLQTTSQPAGNSSGLLHCVAGRCALCDSSRVPVWFRPFSGSSSRVLIHSMKLVRKLSYVASSEFRFGSATVRPKPTTFRLKSLGVPLGLMSRC